MARRVLGELHEHSLESPAMCRARELIDRYAPSALSILLVGATGTGKELLARHIHARSGRIGRFVAVNCGALPHEMAEGLLFGYERGAFSGAVTRHHGHVECAEGGTLFLDELLSLPLDGQVKLLRTLDTGEIQRLGEETERYLDVRVVGAMQEDIAERVASGGFRRDLYQRLAGLVIELLPLAARMEDVRPLAEYFAGQRGQRLEPRAVEELTSYSWPGNVRELRLAIGRAGLLVPARELALTIVECEAHKWDTRSAAASLGIARSTLYYRLKAAGVSPRASRKAHLEFHWNSMEFQRGPGDQ